MAAEGMKIGITVDAHGVEGYRRCKKIPTFRYFVVRNVWVILQQIIIQEAIVFTT